MATHIKVPYKPRNWAKPFHASFKRFAALVLHRRAGKTTAMINHLQRSATDDDWEARRLRSIVPTLSNDYLKELLKDRVYGHVYPTYRQAKRVVWDKAKWYAKQIPGVKTNESELTVRFPNNCLYGLFGADNPDSLRGVPFWGLGFDEYSQHPANIFSEVLSKSLADHLGYAVFSGTIKGKNQLYRTYKAAKKAPDDWFSLWQDVDKSFRTESGPTIELLKIALADDVKLVDQGLMTQDEFDQEWYLSPTAAVKGAVYGTQISAARKQGRIRIVPYDPELPVHTVWDLGTGRALAIGFYQAEGRNRHMIDYWQGEGDAGIVEGIAAVGKKPYVYAKHYAPHDIRAKELTSGKTRFDTAKKLGFVFEIVPSVSLESGLDKGKLFWSRLYVDERSCEPWLDSISAYHFPFDERRGDYGKEPYHDWSSHGADVHRYAALVEDKMTNEGDRKRYVQPSYVPHSPLEKVDGKDIDDFQSASAEDGFGPVSGPDAGVRPHRRR